MTDVIGRAQFGNKGGGHRLLDSSNLSDELLEEVRWHTDLPPQAKSDWPPFFAGYRKGDYYVVQRTTPDHHAERPGMVLTSLAVYPVASLEGASMAELKAGIEGVDFGATADKTRPEGVGPAIDVLSSRRELYWIGDATFDTAIERLWELITYRDRVNFVFGLLFSPSSIPYPTSGNSIAFYLVPATLRSRFDEAATIDSDRPPAPAATAQAVLRPERQVAADLGIAQPTLREWRMLAAVEDYLGRTHSLSHEETRSCLHLLSALTAAHQALEAKARVATHLKTISPHASFGEVRSCRNIPFVLLAELTLPDLLDPWSAAVIGEKRQSDLSAAISSFEDSSGDDFEVTLEASLSAACEAAGVEVVHRFSDAIAADDRRTFTWLAKHSTDRQAIDRLLAASTQPGSADWLHVEAIANNLAEMHAASCPLTDSVEAWKCHLAMGEHTTESRNLLASRCEGVQLVQAALAIGDRHLTNLAGKAVANELAPLTPVAPMDRNWLAVLGSAADAGADPWTFIDAREAVAPVFEAYFDGAEDLLPLVAALAGNEAIDVLRLPRRAETWSKVPEPYRSQLLIRAALAATLRGETAKLEPPLVQAVCSEANLRAAATLDVGRAIDALESLAPHCNARGASAIAEVASLAGSSQRFGQIIAAQRWTTAARFLVEQAARRPDLRAAADECRHVLPAWERMMLIFGSGSRPRQEDLSEGVLELATRLYPTGPQQRGLWERAGGNMADLSTSGTGRDQWASAIKAIVNGSSGAPSMADLLGTVTVDFPGNTSIQSLREVL